MQLREGVAAAPKQLSHRWTLMQRAQQATRMQCTALRGAPTLGVRLRCTTPTRLASAVRTAALSRTICLSRETEARQARTRCRAHSNRRPPDACRKLVGTAATMMEAWQRLARVSCGRRVRRSRRWDPCGFGQRAASTARQPDDCHVPVHSLYATARTRLIFIRVG